MSMLKPKELIPLLQAELVKAKESKDHELAGKLRMQLWVCTDLAQGVKTKMSDDEYRDIIQSLPQVTNGQIKQKKDGHQIMDEATVEQTEMHPSLTTTERKLKNLHKRLTQILDIKLQQAKGHKLEKNQLAKIEKEDEIRQEIQEIENIISSVHENISVTGMSLINNTEDVEDHVTIGDEEAHTVTGLVDTTRPSLARVGASLGTNASNVKNKIRNLKKTLKQIEELKVKQEAGDNMDDTQIEKISKEGLLRQELLDLEK